MVYKKRKKKRAGLIAAIIFVAAALLGVGAYFGYRQYIIETHPLKYQTYVEKYAAQNGLDKYLVYAVIKTESGFKTDAVSNVGARGLMQIMEETFDWIKYKRDDDGAVYFDMYNAQKNIDYGCWLLGYLYEEFGTIEATAAAYHAGRGTVNEWLSDARYSPDGVHLEVIPTPDTAHYVDKIKNALQTYKKLYDNDK